jgi:hypothetical protein
MSEAGFGSRRYTPALDIGDIGFGSPRSLGIGVEATSTIETGFGSPRNPADTNIVLAGNNDVLPDDGGVTLRILSQNGWDGLFIPTGSLYAGPFTVSFINRSTLAETVSYGLLGKDCYSSFAHNLLIGHVPPLERGSYDVQVAWSPNGNLTQTKATITNAFTVICRPRVKSGYKIRVHLPGHFNAGPQHIEEDTIGLYEKPTNIGAIMSVFADAIDSFNGKPTTATTSVFAKGDSTLNVESTIGFPAKGAVWVGGYRLAYTAKTNTSFTGVTCSLYIPEDILSRAEVSFDVRAI